MLVNPASLCNLSEEVAHINEPPALYKATTSVCPRWRVMGKFRRFLVGRALAIGIVWTATPVSALPTVNGKPSSSCPSSRLSATPILKYTPPEISDLLGISEKAPRLHPTSTPRLSDTKIQNLSSFKDGGGKWTEVRSRSKRRKRSNLSASSSAINNTICYVTKPSFNITVIFAAVNSNQKINCQP